MLTVLSCIRDEHDQGLVLIAAVVCVIAAVTAMRFYRRIRTAGSSQSGLGWSVLTGLVAGSGVWATHFVAMLAYSPGVSIRFDGTETFASLVVAASGAAAGFATAARVKTRVSIALGGIIVGLSIVAMHFMGIAAMESAFDIEWRAPYVVAAILWSAAGSAAALFAAERRGLIWTWVAAPVLFVVAVVGLHFTAMTAMIAIPDLTHASAPELFSRPEIAVMVGVIATLIIGSCAAMAGIETHSRKRGMRSLEIAFQGVPSGLALFDPDGRLVIWNAAYEKLVHVTLMRPFVGATRQELLRQSAPAMAVGVAEADYDDWARLKASQRHDGVMQEWPTPSGGWLRTELSRLPDGSTITVLSDISAERETRAAMAEARDKAEAANRAKSEFLTNMSHEIRTPLNGVLGMAQVIEADELTPIQRERVKVVRESGQALLAILNDLLDLSKVQAGKLEIDMGDVDIDHLAHTVTSAFDGAAASRDLALNVEVGEGVAGLWTGDALRIRQILSNLVGNALKFTHAGGVTLAVDCAAEGLAFRVTDTGIGIKAEHLPHLFDAFTQGDATTTRRYGGTGLGLSISGDLVALMGGTISVASTPGEGSCFTVVLPMIRTGDAPIIEAAATPQERADDRPLRILAAEDNATNQLVLRSLLAPTGCELVLVDDGAKAVQAMAREDFDVILMDIQMPEMNGVEATLAIRAAERAKGRRATPIIALSANVMSHQLKEYTEAGMNHWVAKPIEVDKLYAALDLVLSEAEAEAAQETAAA